MYIFSCILYIYNKFIILPNNCKNYKGTHGFPINPPDKKLILKNIKISINIY